MDSVTEGADQWSNSVLHMVGLIVSPQWRLCYQYPSSNYLGIPRPGSERAFRDKAGFLNDSIKITKRPELAKRKSGITKHTNIILFCHFYLNIKGFPHNIIVHIKNKSIIKISFVIWFFVLLLYIVACTVTAKYSNILSFCFQFKYIIIKIKVVKFF